MPDTPSLDDPLVRDADGRGWLGVSGRRYRSYLAGMDAEMRFVNLDERQLGLRELHERRMHIALVSGGMCLSSSEMDTVSREATRDWVRWHPRNERTMGLDELIRWRMFRDGQTGWSADELNALQRRAIRDWRSWHPRNERSLPFAELVRWRMLDRNGSLTRAEWNRLQRDCQRDYQRWHPHEPPPELDADALGFLRAPS